MQGTKRSIAQAEIAVGISYRANMNSHLFIRFRLPLVELMKRRTEIAALTQYAVSMLIAIRNYPNANH